MTLNPLAARRSDVLPWLPAVAYVATIWSFSSRAVPAWVPGAVVQSDKLVHMLEYLVLGALVTYAVLKTWPRSSSRAFKGGCAWLIVAGWGAVDELHQWAVPERTADVLDLLADAIGGIVGVVVVLAIATLLPRRRTKALSKDTYAHHSSAPESQPKDR